MNEIIKMIEWVVILIIFVLTIMLMTTILNNIDPPPTFRERCVVEGGTYIDNNGKAGESCIYNGG